MGIFSCSSQFCKLLNFVSNVFTLCVFWCVGYWFWKITHSFSRFYWGPTGWHWVGSTSCSFCCVFLLAWADAYTRLVCKHHVLGGGLWAWLVWRVLVYTKSVGVCADGKEPCNNMCYLVCLWQCSVRAESVHAPWGAVVDKLYIPDNVVVLWLLYPYRIITLGSNKHNGDDAPWSCR